MKKILITSFIIVSTILLIGCESTQERCDNCKALEKQIRYEKSINGLNMIMYQYMNCPECN